MSWTVKAEGPFVIVTEDDPKKEPDPDRRRQKLTRQEAIFRLKEINKMRAENPEAGDWADALLSACAEAYYNEHGRMRVPKWEPQLRLLLNTAARRHRSGI